MYNVDGHLAVEVENKQEEPERRIDEKCIKSAIEISQIESLDKFKSIPIEHILKIAKILHNGKTLVMSMLKYFLLSTQLQIL